MGYSLSHVFQWTASKRILKMIDKGENTDMLGKRSLILTEKSIFIFISSIAAYILPVRVFKNENEKKKFIINLNYMVDRGTVKKNIK